MLTARIPDYRNLKSPAMIINIKNLIGTLIVVNTADTLQTDVEKKVVEAVVLAVNTLQAQDHFQ
jgi:hypothetical protein